jgi:para-nitrobenzyl esterase
MVGTNRDEMAFFYWERRANDIFTLTDDGLKSRLREEFGANAEKILSTYRVTRPGASPADIYIAITTSRAMWLGSIEIAEKKFAQEGAPVYMYMFTHESSLIVPGTNHRLGAAHATEIQYKFNNVDLQGPDPQRPALIGGEDPDRRKAALNMSEMWATFARTGHPRAKGQPSWPRYTPQQRATMMIDTQCRVEMNPFGPELALWDGLKS